MRITHTITGQSVNVTHETFTTVYVHRGWVPAEEPTPTDPDGSTPESTETTPEPASGEVETSSSAEGTGSGESEPAPAPASGKKPRKASPRSTTVTTATPEEPTS